MTRREPAVPRPATTTTAMFITPDLFTATEAGAHHDTYIAPDSVHVTYEYQPSVLGKRRRIGGERAAEVSPRSKMQLTLKPHENSLTRCNSRTLPSPPPEDEFGYELERTKADLHRTPPQKHRRRVLPVKKRLPATDILQSMPASAPNVTPILTPCHVCYKAPRLKRELDAFEDCWRCHERTCFICMRQCQAGCLLKKVCRQCCVEQGEDGDVSCLDCLQGKQDEEMEG